MCVLYVSFGSNVKLITFGCVAMRSAVLFIFMPRLLLYYAGSGVNRVKVVLSGFSVRLFPFVHAKLYEVMVVCISLLHSCLCVCRCDGDVICIGHDLNRCTGWW